MVVLDSSQGNSIFQYSYCVTVGWSGRGGAGLQPGQLHLPDHDDPLDEGEISFLAGQNKALNMGQTPRGSFVLVVFRYRQFS